MAEQVIDVTGLPAAVVADLRRYVDKLRANPPGDRNGPPPDETPEQWVARYKAWIARQPKAEGVSTLDDSRDSIYEGCGE